MSGSVDWKLRTEKIMVDAFPLLQKHLNGLGLPCVAKRNLEQVEAPWQVAY